DDPIRDSPGGVVWTPEEQSFGELEDGLVDVPVLALLDSKGKFELYVDVKQDHAKGILVREHGETQGWPHCLRGYLTGKLMRV
uniref:Uncharacterized protein n=1 Tax=Geospiza parvula TaxID=87175 RepID=A0A8C3MA51_GEOPR